MSHSCQAEARNKESKMYADHQFPASDVLDWYTDAESLLVDFLQHIPYCASHEEVWSPKLVTILQETCSQLDSLWRWEAVHIHGRKSTVNIKDYFELFGPELAEKPVLFWADEPVQIAPFAKWHGVTEFKKEAYAPLDWWAMGYQKIKHNRLENRTCATLKRTVEALSGLFLALVRCESCWQGLWQKRWLSSCDQSMPDPLYSLEAVFKPTDHHRKHAPPPVAVESKLFAYRVSRCKEQFRALRGCPYGESGLGRQYRTWCSTHPDSS